MNLILACTEVNGQCSLANCKTSAEKWSDLLGQFSKSSTEFVQHLQQQFYDYRFKIGSGVTSHIASLKTLIFELKDVGVDIT